MKPEYATELLEKIVKCAKEAGIYEYMFLAFGSLLGCARPTYNRSLGTVRTGVMDHDNDMDVGFLAGKIGKEKIENYFQLCVHHGLMRNWPNPDDRMCRRGDDGSILWFSTKAFAGHAKCCQWFWMEHGDFLFHGKNKWARRFSNEYKKHEGCQSALLGAPKKYFDELIEVDFEGVKINIPVKTGSLLDYWYPGWSVPKVGGTSDRRTILWIKDWKDKDTWRVE
jgi:hypothetical protein